MLFLYTYIYIYLSLSLSRCRCSAGVPKAFLICCPFTSAPTEQMQTEKMFRWTRSRMETLELFLVRRTWSGQKLLPLQFPGLLPLRITWKIGRCWGRAQITGHPPKTKNNKINAYIYIYMCVCVCFMCSVNVLFGFLKMAVFWPNMFFFARFFVVGLACCLC